METELLQTLAQGGPVAVLAYLIFWSYRKDRKSSAEKAREDRMFMEDRLTSIIRQDQKSRESHTKAITELVVLLKDMNGRKRDG